MAFGIAPVTSYPPAGQAAFPLYMQWRYAGTNLGDAGVIVIDFTGPGLKATRGIGENSHIITVRRESLLQQMSQPASEVHLFDEFFSSIFEEGVL